MDGQRWIWYIVPKQIEIQQTKYKNGLEEYKKKYMAGKDEAPGVGIVTKQNATKDVPVGGQYMNVKKLKLGKGKLKKCLIILLTVKDRETGDSQRHGISRVQQWPQLQKAPKHPAEKGSWHVGRLICEEAERRKNDIRIP